MAVFDGINQLNRPRHPIAGPRQRPLNDRQPVPVPQQLS
jgi:hypothetical protein